MECEKSEPSAREENQWREVAIPLTEQRVMRSRAGNREYRIFIAKPGGEPPPSGYPVIYLLDANAVFGTMVEAMRAQARRPEKTGVHPMVIVGIGYQTKEPFSSDRYYDFTVPVTELPPRRNGTPWPKHGGAESFLTFIEEELKPQIERQFKIDKTRQTIVGHSLGGLFVLHVLFTKPSAFQAYVAGSPSIHWGKPHILDEERQFVSLLDREDIHVRLMIAVGELEKSHKSGMCENAKGLFRRLSAFANRGVYTEFKEFKGENHVSVLPVLMSRAIRFAAEDEKKKRRERMREDGSLGDSR